MGSNTWPGVMTNGDTPGRALTRPTTIVMAAFLACPMTVMLEAIFGLPPTNMTKTLYSLLLLATLRADDSVETRLAQPLLNSKQTMVEAQIYLASRVKPMPPIRDRAEWEKYAADLRRQILDNVVFRGEAAKWRVHSGEGGVARHHPGRRL